MFVSHHQQKVDLLPLSAALAFIERVVADMVHLHAHISQPSLEAGALTQADVFELIWKLLSFAKTIQGLCWFSCRVNNCVEQMAIGELSACVDKSRRLLQLVVVDQR